jgi:hypothetical protein
MAFAGTKITITIMDSIFLQIGKSDEVAVLRLPHDFASAYLNTPEQVLNFVDTHIDRRPFNLEGKPELLAKLIGRRRLSANFIREIYRIMAHQEEEANIDYDLVATMACNKAYSNIVADLTKSLYEQWEYDVTGSKSQLSKY